MKVVEPTELRSSTERAIPLGEQLEDDDRLSVAAPQSLCWHRSRGSPLAAVLEVRGMLIGSIALAWTLLPRASLASGRIGRSVPRPLATLRDTVGNHRALRGPARLVAIALTIGGLDRAAAGG